MEPLELKNIITKIKNSVDGLDTAEERMCEVKDSSVENNHIEPKNRKNKVIDKRGSGTYGM